MKIFFSVGEPSGDLHAANLIRELKKHDSSIDCVGFGGPKMQSESCEVLFELTQLSLMLFSFTLLRTLPKFFALKKRAANYFDTNRPDAVVLVDYPGFNWHIARLAKQRGIPVFYYGVPQMWAWASHRVKKLKRDVDHVLCKLPFEPKWFRERGCQAEYVGHPYFDELHQRAIDREFIEQHIDNEKPLLTLLPGSRRQEVTGNVDVMLDAACQLQHEQPNLQIAIASFNQEQAAFVRKRLADRQLDARVFVGNTPELIDAATVCIACSGSVSLELMFHGKPTVICYRVNHRNKFLGRLVLRCKYITLPNLMAVENIEKPAWWMLDPDDPQGERVPFPEYFSTRNESQKIARWIRNWLENKEERQIVENQLAELNEKYASAGASSRATKYILQQLAKIRSSETNTKYAA